MKSILSFCTAALLALNLQAATSLDESTEVGGFSLGCQAYSFKDFTAFEAIEKTRAAGGNDLTPAIGQIKSRVLPLI